MFDDPRLRHGGPAGGPPPGAPVLDPTHRARMAGVFDDLGGGLGDAARSAGEGVRTAGQGVAEGARGAGAGISDAAGRAGEGVGSAADSAATAAKWTIGLAVGIPVTLGLAGIAAFVVLARGAQRTAGQVGAAVGPELARQAPALVPAAMALIAPEGAALAGAVGAMRRGPSREEARSAFEHFTSMPNRDPRFTADGYYIGGPSLERPIIEAYNGRSWREATSPALLGPAAVDPMAQTQRYPVNDSPPTTRERLMGAIQVLDRVGDRSGEVALLHALDRRLQQPARTLIAPGPVAGARRASDTLLSEGVTRR